MNQLDLAGRTAVAAGGAQGIGLAIATRLRIILATELERAMQLCDVRTMAAVTPDPIAP